VAQGVQAVLGLATRALALLSPPGGAPPAQQQQRTRRAAVSSAAAAAATAAAAAARPVPQSRPHAAPPVAAPPVSEDAIDALCQMGFDRRDAIAALQHGGGDVTLAAELLLAGGS
jgi:hypothetical protein